MNLKGKVAIVSGGSNGIGKAILYFHCIIIKGNRLMEKDLFPRKVVILWLVKQLQRELQVKLRRLFEFVCLNHH